MAIITKSMLVLIAPILTYTADEIIDNAPAIIKGDAQDIFDFTYQSIPAVESSFNHSYMTKARFAFQTIIDVLKKEKTIKNTLELIIETSSKTVSALDKVEAEDWFVVSGIVQEAGSENLGTFEVDGDKFTIYKATEAKCPRCWKYKAKTQETTCDRCSRVVNA